ncbi:hypothetical protein ONZ45_g10406 [Pleurotus djamor]|nr:hypothetical protein ONZ45_g10406 [Pleurotus djamor]
MSCFTDLVGQHRIDRQIVEHEAAIYRLKLERNALSGVHNLPSDVLSIIALIYKELNVNARRGSWLSILGVCTRWRQLILDLPRFWGTISSEDFPFIDAMLLRSHETPLCLYYKIHPRLSMYNLWCWATPERAITPPRTVNLISITYAMQYSTFTASFYSFLASNPAASQSIRTLRLVRDDRRFSEALSASAPYHLESQILVDHMSSLRSLELVDVLLPCDIPSLPSLRNLDVSCATSPYYGLSIFWVSNVLQQCPNIEYVTLRMLTSTDHEADILQISLPRLRTLYVDMDTLEGFELFDLLDLPNHAHITVNLYKNLIPAPIQQIAPYAFTASRFSQVMSGFCWTPLEKIVIYRNEFFGEFKLCLYSPSDDSPFLTLNLPDACIDLHHYTDWFSLTSLSLSSVANLTIDDDTVRLASQLPLHWVDFLKLFTNLKLLNLVNIQPNESAPILRSLLCSDASTDTDESQHPVIIPTLEAVSFSCVDWSAVLLDSPSLHGSLGVPVSALNPRQGLKFVIVKCTIEEEEVEMLRRYIVVDWDGVTREEMRQDWLTFAQGCTTSGAPFDVRVSIKWHTIVPTLVLTTMPSASDLDRQRRRIDEKIAEHEAEIRRLKYQRNELSAAHSLPSEILSEIAAIYKELTVFTGRASWLSILGVCTRWRRLIIDLPQFWATISSDDWPFIATMLQRSIHTPLRLYQRLDVPFPCDLWEALLVQTKKAVPQSTNIDTISLIFATDSVVYISKLIGLIHRNFRSLSSITTLRLKRGESQASTAFREAFVWPKARPYHLDRQILLQLMTSLRFLELTDILIPYDIPPLPSLRTLIVSCTPSSYGLSLFWVSRMLRHTPNIEDISLSILTNTVISNTVGYEVDTLLISLPKLNTLNVEMDDLECFQLFDFLEFPSHTRSSVTLISYSTSPPKPLESSCALTAARFSKVMSGFRGKPLGKVSIYRDEFFGEFRFRLYSPGSEFPFLDLNLPPACLDLHHYTEWSSPQFALPPLPFGSVSELTIDDNTLRAASGLPLAWNDFLKLFTSLKVLNLVNIEPNWLPLILQIVITVEVISFSCIDWTFVRLRPSSFLHNRLGHLKFVVSKCTIDQEEVDRLRQYVSVDWDGVTREGAPRNWWLYTS